MEAFYLSINTIFDAWVHLSINTIFDAWVHVDNLYQANKNVSRNTNKNKRERGRNLLLKKILNHVDIGFNCKLKYAVSKAVLGASS